MPEPSASAPLNDVMLAMDVVDTLRHQRTLVERELNEEERERALIVRLREIYAGQGIEVPDSVLAEGVAALKEDRFTYRSPEPGLSHTLAKLYVNRGKWGKIFGSIAVLAATVWLAYLAFVTWPESRRLAQAQSETAQQIRTVGQSVTTQRSRIQRVGTLLDEAQSSSPDELSNTVRIRVTQAKQDLLDASATLDGINLAEVEYTPALERQIAVQQQQLNSAIALVDGAETQVNAIRLFSRLTDELPSKQQTVLGVSEDPAADSRANRLLAAGLSAVKSGDVEGGNDAARQLDQLLAQLNSVYEIRVINRPGERSGVWRIPPNNESGRNYYLIVEALDSSGQPVKVSMTDEELGKLVTVGEWGMRVSQQTFNRMGVDKQDDGIIQNNRFGVKKRGYLTPEYFIQTTGASITRW